MASDGRNILYTSYNDHEPHVIAYCLIDNGQNVRDEKQVWNSQRVEDMVWWKKIQKFVCASRNAIYTVDRTNQHLKILCVARGNWAKINVAGGDNHFFVHVMSRNVVNQQINEIGVYAMDFSLISLFDAGKQKYFSLSESFCATDHMLVSARTISEDGHRVMYVNGFDLNMHQLGWTSLGACGDSIEIRTDGKGCYFVSTGERKLHIVSADWKFKTINLKDEGDCIAVLDNQRIAVSKGRSNIELVTY